MPPNLDQLSPEQRQRYEDLHARIMAALPYERVEVRGDQALSEWERLTAEGLWSVVVGGDDDLVRIAEQFSLGDPDVEGGDMPAMETPSPEQILDRADSLTYPDDLASWEGSYPPEDQGAEEGEWPDEVLPNEPGLTQAIDLNSGEYLPRVHILRIPTERSYEVPAYLRWGGWNACPPAEYHVAALRHWRDAYGAELVGLGGDVMNIRVARRPQTQEEALMLAYEQYSYCPDIVDQGVGTVAALAAVLMASDWWFFWWD